MICNGRRCKNETERPHLRDRRISPNISANTRLIVQSMIDMPCTWHISARLFQIAWHLCLLGDRDLSESACISEGAKREVKSVGKNSYFIKRAGETHLLGHKSCKPCFSEGGSGWQPRQLVKRPRRSSAFPPQSGSMPPRCVHWRCHAAMSRFLIDRARRVAPGDRARRLRAARCACRKLALVSASYGSAGHGREPLRASVPCHLAGESVATSESVLYQRRS